MSFLGRLFGRGKHGEAAEHSETPVACSHTTLTAKWDSVRDMGIEAKASSWVCSTCDESFTPEQAAEVRRLAGERLRGA